MRASEMLLSDFASGMGSQVR